MQIRYLVDKISFLKYIHCNIPMDNGLIFEMKIDVDNGRVIRNNNCAEHIKFKTGQDNTIILFDKDYNKITWYSEEEKDFVDRYIGEIPSFLNNGEDDDCIDIEVDDFGYIKNFKRKEVTEIIETIDF